MNFQSCIVFNGFVYVFCVLNVCVIMEAHAFTAVLYFILTKLNHKIFQMLYKYVCKSYIKKHNDISLK